MKVTIKNKNNILNSEQIEVVELFIKFLQKYLKLSEDIIIEFTNKRIGKMTTGIRNPNNLVKILSSDRMLIDILRTLSHEWVHEYQDQVMNILKGKKIKDIGGPEENMANTVSGIFIKKFQKLNPNLEKLLYK